MTSKTFKSHSELAKTISVTRSQGRVLVEIEDPKHLIAINVSDTDAPALALAILEAAGVVPVQRDYESYDDGTPAHLQAVAYFLKQHNEAQERATAEARERAELEAEALELANAFWDGMDRNQIDSWGDESGNAKQSWIAAARRAREMRTEK